jgi:hypothetical protein
MSKFISLTRFFTKGSSFAKLTGCTQGAEKPVLELSNLSKPIVEFLADPLKKPATLDPSWSFVGASSSASALFHSLNKTKLDGSDIEKLPTIPDCFNAPHPKMWTDASRAGKLGASWLQLHEGLQLLTKLLASSAQITELTSLGQVKRFNANATEFAQSLCDLTTPQTVNKLHQFANLTHTLRTATLRGMQPLPVVSTLRSSSIFHEGTGLFAPDCLKQADLEANLHFRDFKPATASRRAYTKRKVPENWPAAPQQASAKVPRLNQQPSSSQANFSRGSGRPSGSRPTNRQNVDLHNPQMPRTFSTGGFRSEQQSFRELPHRTRGTAAPPPQASRGRGANYRRPHLPGLHRFVAPTRQPPRPQGYQPPPPKRW